MMMKDIRKSLFMITFLGTGSSVIAGVVLGPDGKPEPMQVVWHGIPDAVREMGPMGLLFYAGVLMVVIGTGWFLLRLARHRQNAKRMKETDRLQQTPPCDVATRAAQEK